ncbi:leucine-rich repeat domain-containing protein [Caenimonas koreensis]|nr:leucine-rich repeat domain-containing protein [Caenimonas koreensis]
MSLTSRPVHMRSAPFQFPGGAAAARTPTLESGLDQWVDAAPPQEAGARRELTRVVLNWHRAHQGVAADQTAPLNLNGMNLVQLPAQIGLLTNLRDLVLNDNQLTELPAEIGELVNLRSIQLTNNQLTQLPAQIGRLSALRELRLNGNPLTHLPDEFWELTGLNILYLAQTRLLYLPSAIERFSGLLALDLSYTEMRHLPAEIGGLNSLRYLGLSGNHLTSLPQEFERPAIEGSLQLTDRAGEPMPPEILRLANWDALRMRYAPWALMPQGVQRILNPRVHPRIAAGLAAMLASHAAEGYNELKRAIAEWWARVRQSHDIDPALLADLKARLALVGWLDSAEDVAA